VAAWGVRTESMKCNGKKERRKDITGKAMTAAPVKGGLGEDTGPFGLLTKKTGGGRVITKRKAGTRLGGRPTP